MRFRRSGPGIGFTEFVAQRSGALFRTAYALTGDVHVAEDLVQEALERACRHWRKVEVADSPEAYVRKVLVNLANDRWRRLSRSIMAASPVCQHCHERLSAVVDHILPRLDRPDLSFEPTNLRALCEDCHGAVGHKSLRGV